MLGNLYIVATPIGNLEDLSLRALRILKEVDLIYCEDTSETLKLLGHFDLLRSLFIYNQHSSDAKKAEILKNLMEGKNIALLTDAGTPGISDPGNELISYLLSNMPSLNIIPIPGASAVTTALSVSGFNASKYIFLGYFPKKGVGKTISLIEEAKITSVFFESPYRIIKTVDALISHFASEAKSASGGVEEREICVCQELTKIHERVIRGNLREVKEVLEKEAKELGRVKGEIVVIIASQGLALRS